MTNRDRLIKALWLCEDVPYTVCREVVHHHLCKGDTMNRKLIDQWQKDFHEVVESLDVEKYKAFYRMYQDDVYGGRPMPKSDKVIMASMCKVALALTTISEATKKKADEWLEANNFSKGIWI